MYVLNNSLFRKALAAKGFSSARQVAAKLKIHRNTVGAYINGKAVLPDAFEQMINLLNLHPGEALVDIRSDTYDNVISKIMPLVDNLCKARPGMTVFLFGSRAKGSAAKYSDFDLGLYSSSGIAHKEFLELVKIKDDYEENLPFFVDLVNFTSAKTTFLQSILNDLVLLAGTRTDFFKLKTTADMQ